ncbi:MAG: type II CAAX endopeptidase family protein [Lachnospiraceae bacterium]|nr:type II CAAX endopeptidase family protein [Lachnospiraceae bacterium]
MNGRKIVRILSPLMVHFGITLAVAFLGSYLYLMLGPEAALAADTTFLTTVASLCCIPALLSMWKRDHELRDSMVEVTKRPWWFYSFALLSGAAVSVGMSAVMNMARITDLFSNQVQEELLSSNILIQGVGLCFIIPAVEELVFRGLFYQRLKEYFTRFPAMLLVSLVFALYHGNPVQMIYAFPLGLIMVWFYEECGSLRAPLLFHIGANLISVILEYLAG